jgi:tRNA A22 N-methylase
MALDECDDNKDIKTVLDVGTDHGLLAASLAASGRFDSVIGVDVSELALNQGARRLCQMIDDYRTANDLPSLPLCYRMSDGLQSIGKGEADVICITGMGTSTMLNILAASDGALLNDLHAKKFLLQPTNTRPKHLISLYSGLHEIGWRIQDERIQKIGSRWYVSVACTKSTIASSENVRMPGAILIESETSRPEVVCSYLEHYCKWLRQDLATKGQLSGGEDQWLYEFEGIKNERKTGMVQPTWAYSSKFHDAGTLDDRRE